MKKRLLMMLANKKIVTGAHKRYAYLVKELAKKGHEINFVNGLDEKLEESNINNINITSHSKKIPIPSNIVLLFKIIFNYKKIKASKSDIILVFGETNFLSAYFLKTMLKIPLVFGARSNILEYRKIDIYSSGLNYGFLKTKNKKLLDLYVRLFAKFEKIIINKSNKVIVQNSYDRKEMLERCNPKQDNFVLIPNNINVNWPDLKLEQGKKVDRTAVIKNILFIGSLDERKGIKVLLKAFKKLIAEGHTDLSLQVLGNGYLEKELKDYILKNNLLEHIKMLGFVNSPMTQINESDLLVVPSLADSFPNVVLEALYLGIPVLGTNVGGIPDILKYEQLLFKPDDVDGLYLKIKGCLDKEEYLKVADLCSKRRNVYMFDWAERFENVIDDELR